MKHRIVHEQPLFGSGEDIVVYLDFDEAEHRLIRDNNMDRVIILEREPTQKVVVDKNGKERKELEDNNVYFKLFYGRRTSWHVDSVLEGKAVHAEMFLGFQRFQEYLEENKTPATHSEGDFKVAPPPPFSIELIPEYMWAQHCFILAESGGGKTQLLQTIVAEQMKKAKPPGFVIIDSQDQILQLIQSKFPQAIMIDPYDNPPSLDIFKSFGDDDFARTFDTFRYLFEAGAQPLTDRQTTPFRYALALMLIGFPKAFGHTATIEDFEQYLMGSGKKGLELPERAHTAASTLPSKEWYYNQYANYREAHGQILQRLSNICGEHTPLRPLFSKQHDTLNLVDAIDSGKIVLVNTKRAKLGPYASSFFGRFFFKLLDRAIGERTENSHPLLFIVDEVQEYFDATVMTPFLDQARKRNISCIFATQRLSHLHNQELLRDALTGVGTLMATNVNSNDVREMSAKFHVEQEQVDVWRPEYVEGDGRPRYADFGFKLKGKSAQTFRLTFGQLEKLKASTRQERTEESPRYKKQEPPGQERPTGAPKDDEFDDRYDILQLLPLSPVKARDGVVMTVKLPSGRDHQQSIPPGTQNGYRFCIKGASRIRRPDNKNGNFWVELEIAEMPGSTKEDF